MGYRGPQAARMHGQTETIFQHAGQTVTWRQYISASGGVGAAGFGLAASFRESTITAVLGRGFRLPDLLEGQRAVGQIPAGEFYVTCRERLGRQDELLWRGEVYRVESEPVPSVLPGLWVAQVKRGEN